MYEVVTPAKAGVQEASPHQHWIPAFAGMTAVSDLIGPQQYRTCKSASEAVYSNSTPGIPHKPVAAG